MFNADPGALVKFEWKGVDIAVALLIGLVLAGLGYAVWLLQQRKLRQDQKRHKYEDDLAARKAKLKRFESTREVLARSAEIQIAVKNPNQVAEVARRYTDFLQEFRLRDYGPNGDFYNKWITFTDLPTVGNTFAHNSSERLPIVVRNLRDDIAKTALPKIDDLTFPW